MPQKALTEMEERDLRTLADDIRRGNCILFIGSGVSVETGFPSAWDLGIELATESDYPSDRDPADLPKVALHYQERYGRERLISKLRSIFAGYLDSADVTSYDLIAEFRDFTRLVTTNWDKLIEEAFGRKKKPLAVIKTEENIPLERTALYALIKLHGDFDTPPDRMTITEDDYTDRYEDVGQVGGLFGLLGSWIGTKTLLFVGYSLRDLDFRYLFKLVSTHVGQAPARHFAIVREIAPDNKAAWEQKNVRVIEMGAQDFFTRLFMELLEFANRDSEIQYICNQATLPFVEVCGFAGSGKTFLLQEARRRYRLKESKWYTPLVDLSETDNEFSIIERLSGEILGRQVSREQLISKVKPEVEEKAQKENRIASLVEIEAAAARRGAERLGHSFKNRQILLLFDAVERAPDRIIRWLEDTLVAELWKAHVDPLTKVRIVFAGRYPNRWRSWSIKGKLFLLEFSPFDEAAVSTMLRSFTARTIKAPLSREQRECIVSRILWLSGGHPRAIRNLLQDLADKRFSVYFEKPDYFEENREKLFNDYVFKDVEESILKNLLPEVRQILFTLGPFRRFNPLLVRELIAGKHLDTQKHPNEVVRDLRATFLIRDPDESDPLYFIDPVMRYILDERMEVNEPDRHAELHKIATELYDGWIAGPAGAMADAQFLRAYTLESLFHHTRLIQMQQEKPEDLEARLQAHLESIRERLPDPDHSAAAIWQILALLEKDRELSQNIVLALGEAGYQAFLQRIDKYTDDLINA
ncbi:MAG: SIR2 family protein [Promethearchaeota archaeon]